MMDEEEGKPSANTSSLVDNIFKEFMEKKEEETRHKSHRSSSKKHKSHHKKHKKHKDRKRSPEDERSESLDCTESRGGDELEVVPGNRPSSVERGKGRESSQDAGQSPDVVKEIYQSPSGEENVEVDLEHGDRSHQSPTVDHCDDRSQSIDPQQQQQQVEEVKDLSRSSEKKKKHKKHKHKERSKDKRSDKDRDERESVQDVERAEREEKSKDSRRKRESKDRSRSVECSDKGEETSRNRDDGKHNTEYKDDYSKDRSRHERYREEGEMDFDRQEKHRGSHRDRHRDEREHFYDTERRERDMTVTKRHGGEPESALDFEYVDKRTRYQGRHNRERLNVHDNISRETDLFRGRDFKDVPKHHRARDLSPQQHVFMGYPDRDDSGRSRHRHKHQHPDSREPVLDMDHDTRHHKLSRERSLGSHRRDLSPENRTIDLVQEDVVVTLDNSPEYPDNDDVIYEGMESSMGSEQRRRRKRRAEERPRSSTMGRHREMSDPQHKMLQHLYEEEENDDDVRAVPDMEHSQEDKATAPPPEGSRLGAYSMFSSSGSQWMQLPKEMEDSEAVNASSWMRLPKELETDEIPGYDSDKELSNFDGAPTKKKVKLSREPKLDVKLDISKALSVKPPPSEKTSDLISSIKNDIIGDLRKETNEGGSKMVTNPEPVAKPIPQMVPPPADLIEGEQNSSGIPSGTEQGAKKVSAIKIGIKITETSAALIASGKKVEEPEANAESQDSSNLEDGEVCDPDSPKALCKAELIQHEEQSGSESSEIHISELSSSGSLSDSASETGEISEEKSKKKKKSKHKKKKKKKDSKKRSHRSKSSSPKRRRRSRSRSSTSEYYHSREFDEVKGVWKKVERWSTTHRSRSRDRYDRYRGRRAGSRERDGRSRYRHRSDSRERHREHRRAGRRSRSRSPGDDAVSDLRVKIDKAKLRQIALKNAYAKLRAGGVELKPDMLAQMKAGGKSVAELTNFCKQIADKDAERQMNRRSSDESSEPELPASDDEGPFISHPFKVKDPASIVMNIRNARQLPILSATEKQSKGSELRLQFPVSSGSHHRDKEKEWVPVEKNTCKTVATLGAIPAKVKPPGLPSEQKAIGPVAPAATPVATTSAATPGGMLAIEAPPAPTPGTSAAVPVTQVAEEDKVFKEVAPTSINIGSVVSERLSAMRKLQSNPHDVQALGTLYKSQSQMNQWAESKNLPGQFTGTTGANLLTTSELAGINQVWAKKDQLKNATPISGGIGKLMLERMGWKEGTGLGKEGSGNVEPLMLDVKIDRKGLTSIEENFKQAATNLPNKVAKDLSGKHPVSALMELCNRKKWGAPHFELVHESGPAHKKNFLFKVIINNMEYQSAIASTNKKQAKAQAATVCLQELGLVPR